MRSKRLELLTEAEKGLDPYRKAAFEGYLIGSLAAIASNEEWNTALDAARTCLKMFYPVVSRG